MTIEEHFARELDIVANETQEMLKSIHFGNAVTEGLLAQIITAAFARGYLSRDEYWREEIK
jgi:hypothetical protein